jgi:hypothetical protein
MLDTEKSCDIFAVGLSEGNFSPLCALVAVAIAASITTDRKNFFMFAFCFYESAKYKE